MHPAGMRFKFRFPIQLQKISYIWRLIRFEKVFFYHYNICKGDITNNKRMRDVKISFSNPKGCKLRLDCVCSQVLGLIISTRPFWIKYSLTKFKEGKASSSV